MKGIVKKLRSRAGESIAEVLVALLISVLGVALLVGMIGASTGVINRSTEAMHRQYGKANASISATGSVILRESGGSSVFSQSVTTYAVSESGGTSTIVYYAPKTS